MVLEFQIKNTVIFHTWRYFSLNINYATMPIKKSNSSTSGDKSPKIQYFDFRNQFYWISFRQRQLQLYNRLRFFIQVFRNRKKLTTNRHDWHQKSKLHCAGWHDGQIAVCRIKMMTLYSYQKTVFRTYRNKLHYFFKINEKVDCFYTLTLVSFQQ